MDHIDIDGEHLNGDMRECRRCNRLAHNFLRKQELQSRFNTRFQCNFDFGNEFWLMTLSFVIMMYTLFLLLQLPAGSKWVPAAGQDVCAEEEGGFGKKASEKVNCSVEILIFCLFCGCVSTFSLLSCTYCELSTPAYLLMTIRFVFAIALPSNYFFAFICWIAIPLRY